MQKSVCPWYAGLTYVFVNYFILTYSGHKKKWSPPRPTKYVNVGPNITADKT